MSHKLKTSYSENKMLLKRSLVVCFELSSLFPTVCYNNIFLLSTTLWPESQNKCQGPKGEQGKGKNKKLLLQSRVALYWRPQAFPFFLFCFSCIFSLAFGLFIWFWPPLFVSAFWAVAPLLLSPLICVLSFHCFSHTSFLSIFGGFFLFCVFPWQEQGD